MVSDPSVIALALRFQQEYSNPIAMRTVDQYVGYACCFPIPHKDLSPESEASAEALATTAHSHHSEHDLHTLKLSEHHLSDASDMKRPLFEKIACKHHRAIATASYIFCFDMEVTEDNCIRPEQR